MANSVVSPPAQIPIVSSNGTQTQQFRSWVSRISELAVKIDSGTPEGNVTAQQGAVYIDDAANVLYIKYQADIGGDTSQGWSPVGGGGGSVLSVFGRTGAVVAQAGDYDASQITNAFDTAANTSDDITQGATNLFFTAAEQSKLAGIASGAQVNTINAGDNVSSLVNDAGYSTLSISHFQVQDDGTTGQATAIVPTALTGMWGGASSHGSGFSFNGATGELTVTTAANVVEFNISCATHQTANNRHELHVVLQQDSGGGYVDIQHQSNYASRNNTQDEGQTTIPGFKVFSVGAGDKFRVAVFHVGVSGTVGNASVAGQTYISATRYD